MGGAEKVVEVLHSLFPDAPIYTSAYDRDAMPAYYRTWDIRTSFLQKLPMKQITHRLALLLYPMAFESFDLSEYDLVLSSSSAFAKGVITHPHTTNICYTHTPMRYAWGARSYMKNEKAMKPLRGLLLPGLHYLRLWDQLASARVDCYIANSSVVARRIETFYRRACHVIPPPVDTSRFQITEDIGDYYILVSRFVPYKRIDLAIDAFNVLGLPLKVVGSGRQKEALQARAKGNIEFLGRVDDIELPSLMARARAYIMPGEEDFGIAPVEANACGRPVIAFAAGGALDSQIDGVTACLFPEQTVESLCAAVRRLNTMEFDSSAIRRHAMTFDTHSFEKRILEIVSTAVAGKEGFAAVHSDLIPRREALLR